MILLLNVFTKLRKATISFTMSVCLSIRPSAWNNSAPTKWIFIKFDIWLSFDTLSTKKFKFHRNLTRITGTLHEDQYKFMIASRWILLLKRDVSDRFAEKIKKHSLCSMNSFSENRAFMTQCGKIWYRRTDHRSQTIRRRHIACWVTMTRIYMHS